jgi:HlyD family secretion protein
MIKDDSCMDRPVNQQPLTRRLRVIVPVAIALIIAGVALMPSIARWFRSETSIDASRIRVAEVVRGDLVREISVERRRRYSRPHRKPGIGQSGGPGRGHSEQPAIDQ